MKTNEAKVIQMPLKDGMWLRPGVARFYFHEGKGIALGTMRNQFKKLYRKGLAKFDHTGWLIWVSNDAINARNNSPLKAA